MPDEGGAVLTYETRGVAPDPAMHPASVPGWAPQDPAEARRRLGLMRAAHAVGADFLKSHRLLADAFGLDPSTLLIFLTVGVGNVQRLIRSRALPPSFPLPDAFIAPVSRRAIAEATGLARETVRRKVIELMADGYLGPAGKGVRTRACFLESGLSRSALASMAAGLRQVTQVLNADAASGVRALGQSPRTWAQPLAAASPEGQAAGLRAPDIRAMSDVAAMRAAFAVANHFLITHRALSDAYDLEPASLVIFLTVAVDGVRAADLDGMGAPPVLALSRRAIARATGLPRETVRRKVAELLARGYLIAQGSGVRTPQGFLSSARFTEAFSHVLVSLRHTAEVLAAEK